MAVIIDFKILPAVTILAVLASVCHAATSSDNIEQTGPQLQCQAPNTATVKVVLRTQQNSSGHWISRVGVKQRVDSGPGGETDHWMVDVEQNTETCEGEDSILETVFYLSAPPSTRGKPTKRPPARGVDLSTTPIEWVCPTCPEPKPCPTSTSIPRSAPPGYERFDGIGFYKVSTQADTWLEARRTCEEEGGHLLIINSQKEADAINTLLQHFPAVSGSVNQGYIFLGAQRVGTTYSTVLGEPLVNTGYVRWNPSEPSGGSEFCLALIRANNLFNDVTCSWKLGFICEHLSIA